MPTIEEIVRESGIKEVMLLCNAMQITASVTINDDESGVHEDIKKCLEGLAPLMRHPIRTIASAKTTPMST